MSGRIHNLALGFKAEIQPPMVGTCCTRLKIAKMPLKPRPTGWAVTESRLQNTVHTSFDGHLRAAARAPAGAGFAVAQPGQGGDDGRLDG